MNAWWLGCQILSWYCSFLQLQPQWRTSRSVHTVCLFIRTELRPSATTVARCCGDWCDRASNVKVQMNYFLNISDFLITLWHFSKCMIHNILHNSLQAVVWIITSDVPLRYPITAVECEDGAPPMFLWQGGWWTSAVLSPLSHHHPITLMMLYWWGTGVSDDYIHHK